MVCFCALISVSRLISFVCKYRISDSTSRRFPLPSACFTGGLPCLVWRYIGVAPCATPLSDARVGAVACAAACAIVAVAACAADCAWTRARIGAVACADACARAIAADRAEEGDIARVAVWFASGGVAGAMALAGACAVDEAVWAAAGMIAESAFRAGLCRRMGVIACAIACRTAACAGNGGSAACVAACAWAWAATCACAVGCAWAWACI